MKREGISRALVGYLPAPWHRSVGEANAALFGQLQPHAEFLSPLPAVNPLWPEWEAELDSAVRRGIVGVRAYPPQWAASDPAAIAGLTIACARRNVALVFTTRFEDARQRHWMDAAPDLGAATVREAARSHEGARVVLTCAGRPLIEEIHWSLTPAERERVWYDISWIWGPPQNDLVHLLTNIGASRFLFGTMWPMRLVQTPFANMELLPESWQGVPLAKASDAFPRLL
jgi:predicted TIM-barrel fold metal-dependent hydrolase